MQGLVNNAYVINVYLDRTGVNKSVVNVNTDESPDVWSEEWRGSGIGGVPAACNTRAWVHSGADAHMVVSRMGVMDEEYLDTPIDQRS